MAPKRGGKRKVAWVETEATPPKKPRQRAVFQVEAEDDSVLRMWDGTDARDDRSGEPHATLRVCLRLCVAVV